MNIKQLMHSALVASVLATCQTAGATAYPSKFDYFMGITSTASIANFLYSRATFASQIDNTWHRYSEIAPSSISLRAKVWVESILRDKGVSESLLQKIVYVEGVRGEISVWKGSESVYFEIPRSDAEFLNATLEKDLETLPTDQLKVLNMLTWICAREGVHLRKTQEWGFAAKRGDQHILTAVNGVISGVTYHVAREYNYGKLASYGIAAAVNLVPHLIFSKATEREEYQCDIQASEDIEILKAGLNWLETIAGHKAISLLTPVFGSYEAAKEKYDSQSFIATLLLGMPHPVQRAACLRAHIEKLENSCNEVLVVIA